MRSAIEAGFQSVMPPALIKELLDAHEEVKRNHYLGGLRLSAVEGGRFCEAAFRILQHITTGQHTPVGTSVQTDQIIRSLQNVAAGSHPDSVRLHIPRSLRVVYDVRNNRDAAHLADGIDPNLQDASLVVAVVDWVVAEFVRLYHNVPANDAQRIVEALVTRRAPAIQDFGGFLKVIRAGLPASDHCLLLLYQRGRAGATLQELSAWARPGMRGNLGRTLRALEHDKAMVHSEGVRYQITRIGEQHVEQRRLFEVEDNPSAMRRSRRRRRVRRRLVTS